jgi:calcium-translocating P-type ATPase
VLAEQIGYLGMAVALFCFIGQTIIWFIDLGRGTCFYTDITGNPLPREDCVLGYPGLDDRSKCELNPHRKWMTTWDNFNVLKLRDIVGFFIDSVTIIVVAVPEGLPLAVTIALAYSVKKMQADKNLVRVMAACETMGGCTNICSDKTGTLTQNQMNVTDGFFAGRASDGFLPTQAELSPAVLAALVESMAVNSKAHIGVDGKSGRPEVIGNKTEGSMLLFLRTLGVDYRTIREAATVRRTFPFSSLKKRMSTIVENEGRSKLLVKGASEVVMALCSHYMTENGTVKQMQEETRTRINQYISKMASQGLRTIALASKELADGIPTSEEELEAQERELCCICVLGIKDPLRKEVPDAVRQCQRAGITIRMLTGDALLTAKNIARECGILTDGTAIEGPDFRTKSPEEQREILRSLQVMARCSPSDKLTLVQRLKEMEEVVAVTGDGTNDAPALKEADVGLSMGIAGTSVAQEASDIVIMDDNFSSIVKSVLWGRSVYDNIRRFLQFQLTVNVVALFICMVGAITGFGTPLKPVQLLWVNLIMDTLGALALATEAPTPDLLQREPYGRNDRLINAHMYRNIAVQSIYQIIVQLGLLWFGARFILDCSDGFGTGGPCVPLKPNGMGKNEDGNYRDTVIYNSFVWMQLFNELNARRIYNEKNCLEGVFGNPIFCFIWIASAIVQFCSVQFGGQVFRTVPLDMYSWIACIAVCSWPLNWVSVVMCCVVHS